MKTSSKLALAFAMAAISSTAIANLATAPTVFSSGEWSVVRTVDTMSDKTSCTGIYKGDRSIQLTREALYISVQGGIESITLRFGEQAAERLRLPTDIEKKVRAVSISGNSFQKLLGSDRLRVQVLTLVRGIATFDLDLSGIDAAVENIQNGCPGEPTGDSDKSSPTSLCGDRVIARLKERGVSEDDIAHACSSR